jgi:hypothetical protein
MPGERKVAKAQKVKVARPRTEKAEPASNERPGSDAKPKAKARVAKPALKAKPKKPEANSPAIAAKVRKTRAPRKAKGTFADLLKKQAELEEIKKGAKSELRRQFDGLVKEAEKIKAQYKELFAESIESAPKTRGGGAKRTAGKIPGLKPYSLQEVKVFIEQKEQGKASIRIPGRKPKSVARMEDAYRHSENAEEILEMLNK